MKKLRLKHYLLISGITIICIIVILLNMIWRHGWEEMSKMDCATNLKQIVLILHQYAEDNDGWFPDKSGRDGLLQLRKYEEKTGPYSKNYPFRFNCPSVHPAKKWAITYDYIGGYKTTSPPDTGFIMDRQGNHKDMGNIGFIDGRVKGFEGKDWRKNANINR